MSFTNRRDKVILDFINPASNDKVLIIGTGVYPKIEKILFENFKCNNIISVDINKINLKNAKRILPKLKFIYMNAQEKFYFKDESFDKVVLTEVLEHLENENFTLREINRILKTSGKLILSVPKKRWFKILSPIFWFQHKREYTEEYIKNVLKNNKFKPERLFVGGNIYELINIWLHLLYKYFLKILHIDLFFEKKINKSYDTGYKGKGTDIIIVAKKIS